MKKALFIFICLPYLAIAAEYPKPALVKGDTIRVRATPNEKGKFVGVLYSNLKVSVLEKSTNSIKIEEESFPWYRVKTEEFEGWCAGKFLEFNPTNWEADTYASSGDMEWFNTRYGDATAFHEAEFNEKSFTIPEYRDLMAAATQGNDKAYETLKRSIIPYLERNPSDPTYAYIKKRLMTLDYFASLINAGVYIILPESLSKPENFEPLYSKVTKNFHHLNQLPFKMRDSERYKKLALEKHKEMLPGVTNTFYTKDFLLTAIKLSKSFCPDPTVNPFIKDKDVIMAQKDSRECWEAIDPSWVSDPEFKEKLQKFRNGEYY